jgi:hypothetical protein
MFFKKALIVIIMSFIILTIIPSSAFAAQEKQVIMIIINQVNYQDLLEMGSVVDMIDNSGIGLMNTRTAGSAIIPKAYATIGAGVRAEGNWINSQAYQSTEDNKLIYSSRTGKNAPDKGIINLDINKLISYNDVGEYQAIAGQLGSLIKEEGLETAAYGNMNVGDENRNPHVMIAMDKWGRVDQGDISTEILIEDASYPGGFRTNFSKIYDSLVDNSAALTIVETGDITRLEEEKENLSPIMYKKHKQAAIQEIDTFIKKTLSLIEEDKKMLLLVTPFASDEDMKNGYQLTPLILHGENIDKGILTSSTTRREGIIGNVDIAPTILNYLNIEETNMVGKPIEILPTDNHLSSLLDMYDFIVATSKNRLPILSFFAIYQIILLVIALIMVLLKGKINNKYYPIIKNLLLSGLVIPVVLLYLPLFRIKSLPLTFVTMIIITALLSWIVYFIGKKVNNLILPIIIVSLLMTIGLMGDIIMGSPLIRTSIFGYDPIIGARYYGVGNEYMGVLIGSALVLFLGLKEIYKIPKSLIIGLLIILIFVIGYPKWGANVGGTITATMATAFVFLRIYKIKIGWKQIIFGFIMVILVVTLMAIIDTLFLESQSHLAGAISLIKEGGIISIFTIISRKIAMNIRLFGVTIWSKVLVATLIVFAILFYKPYGELKKVFERYPYISKGWAAIVVASITGFMVNDSGVVAAATCLIFLSFSLLYILIQEPHNL